MPTVTPWMSERDLEVGKSWTAYLDKALEDADFGIACTTSSNYDAPWISYEFGNLTGKKIAVCPYLIDLEPPDLIGTPLAQYQAKRTDKTGTWELLSAINMSHKEKAISERK